MSFFFVSFTDKGGSEKVALSPTALSLREQRGIALDVLDYAVSPIYVDSLRRFGVRVCYTTRWLNGATVEMTEKQAEKVAGWSFVKSVEMTRSDVPSLTMRAPQKRFVEQEFAEEADYQTQLDIYNLTPLHEAGFRGQGVTIGLIDCGFQHLNTLTMFDSIRKNGQLSGTYDFADYVDDFYEETPGHGSMCLGLIAGNREDYQGAANQARFYALRSEEIPTESPKEADNWIAAVEKCDSLGVWIVSVSLGYSVFDNAEWNYVYQGLNGHTYRASRAASIASRKGMLLCVAAGNSAKTDWPWINVPADADSILAVGAVDKDSVIAGFSSVGPTPDKRVKPDVCAMGYGCTVVDPGTDGLRSGNGTSFATPLLAGLAACLWSAYPQETNMQIRERIIHSAHMYSNPHHQYGYGIPDAWKAYMGTANVTSSTEEPGADVRKELREGQVVIIRRDGEYSILGNKLK